MKILTKIFHLEFVFAKNLLFCSKNTRKYRTFLLFCPSYKWNNWATLSIRNCNIVNFSYHGYFYHKSAFMSELNCLLHL